MNGNGIGGIVGKVRTDLNRINVREHYDTTSDYRIRKNAPGTVYTLYNNLDDVNDYLTKTRVAHIREQNKTFLERELFLDLAEPESPYQKFMREKGLPIPKKPAYADTIETSIRSGW